MIGRKLVFLGVLIGAGLTVLAQAARAVTVKTLPKEYVTKNISAQNVRGIKIKISKDVLCDCNQHWIQLEKSLIQGTGDGLFDRYIIEAPVASTRRGCPAQQLISQTLSTSFVITASGADENKNGNLDVTLIIPKNLHIVEVSEILNNENFSDLIESDETLVELPVYLPNSKELPPPTPRRSDLIDQIERLGLEPSSGSKE